MRAIGGLLYAVEELGALGKVEGIACPLAAGNVQGSYESYYVAGSQVFVGLNNPNVGKISYALTYDGAHCLNGPAYLGERLVGNISVRRTGYE